MITRTIRPTFRPNCLNRNKGSEWMVEGKVGRPFQADPLGLSKKSVSGSLRIRS
jgi:hypothetical protein